MDSKLTAKDQPVPCHTCVNFVGRKSIDDVPPDCYHCVWSNAKTGLWPHYKRDPSCPEKTPMPIELIEVDEPTQEEQVNHPRHYKTGGIETIDYIQAKLGDEGTVAYCLGNVIKYTSRWKDKGGLTDLKKAKWYLEKAIELKE